MLQVDERIISKKATVEQDLSEEITVWSKINVVAIVFDDKVKSNNSRMDRGNLIDSSCDENDCLWL